jgi:hypothetical protein
MHNNYFIIIPQQIPKFVYIANANMNDLLWNMCIGVRSPQVAMKHGSSSSEKNVPRQRNFFGRSIDHSRLEAKDISSEQ